MCQLMGAFCKVKRACRVTILANLLEIKNNSSHVIDGQSSLLWARTLIAAFLYASPG
jgi:hypothetical protein